MSARAIGVLATAAVAVGAIVLATSSGSGSPEDEDAPRGFYGIVSQTPLTAQDFARMGEGRVGTLRILLPWSTVDSTPASDDLDFSTVDPIVLAAAEHGIRIL
ncbi:MAG TPA: hypothetical protein VFY37_04765, partial [Solirubrobacterales bacterium]|nr:hypothetical protein [Solirubrobacterales bacterium]